ncbi:GbpC/Spa domain-containing protein [Streptococcus australis]|uniref:GbpC/Spa domain-containing protein n=1 Tax=Streptococcus australis TaxID=113107 RepID=UPI0039C3A30B
MSSFKNNKTIKYALRKTSVAFGSVAVATMIATAGIATVSADETSSATTPVTTTKTVSGEETKEVAVPEKLEEAKTAATNEGLEVKETETKKQDSEEAAAKDYEKQVTDINKTVADYKAEVAANQEAYEKEKAEVDAKNAAAQANYDKELAVYNEKLTAYQKELTEKTLEKTAVEKSNEEARVTYEKALEEYNTALAAYNASVKVNQEATESNKLAQAEYETKLAEYKTKKAAYDEAQAAYLIELEIFNKKKSQYDDAKDAFNKMVTERGGNPAKYKQDLTFLSEELADGETTKITHQTSGLTTYLTKEGQSRMYGDGKATKMYETKNLQDSDVTTTNPYANNEIEWGVVKVGDKFDVTYTGLTQAKIVKGSEEKRIAKVVYKYEVKSLPSSDGKGIVQIYNDPAVTMTIGSSTDTENPVTVGVDIEFYDENDQLIDLSQHNAILALNSINHWNGASYVENDKPRTLVVEAKDSEGNTVRGTWDPYSDGTEPKLDGADVVVKSGKADFGSAEVDINADNPLKIVSQKATWVDDAFKVTEETVVDATTVNASGGGNGHSVGTEDYTFGDKSDVIGTYTVDATSGVLRYTPKMKHQNTPHVESVNIGDKEFIKLPNSSVDQDSSTKEVSAKEQNQYMDQGATFNADSSSETKGWDDPKSPYLYYGGAAVILKDGHLEFTAKGANATDEATLYWFSINSNVAFPQDPGEEPVKPTEPTPPVKPEKPELTEVPTVKEKPVPPTEPKYKTVPVLPSEPVKPEAPELLKDPVKKETEKPVVEWHKNVVLIKKDEKPQPKPGAKQEPKPEPKPGSKSEPKQKDSESVLPNTGSVEQSFMTYSALIGLATAGYALSRKKKAD